MDVSTDGILFYGFDLGEPGESLTKEGLEKGWYKEYWDVEEFYLEQKGVVRGVDEDYNSWKARKNPVLEEAGSIGYHCSDSYQMLYVASYWG